MVNLQQASASWPQDVRMMQSPMTRMTVGFSLPCAVGSAAFVSLPSDESCRSSGDFTSMLGACPIKKSLHVHGRLLETTFYSSTHVSLILSFSCTCFSLSFM